MLFEFIGNGVPFGEQYEDSYKVYEAILHQELRFPSFVKSNSSARNLIMQLLNRSAAARGTPGTIKKHIWFRNLDFESLHTKQVKPTYIPKTASLNTTSTMIGSIEQICSRNEDLENVGAVKKQAPEGWDVDF
jgi:cGMP-dependent protein kinase